LKDLKKEINETLVNVSNTIRKQIKPGMYPVPKKPEGAYKKEKIQAEVRSQREEPTKKKITKAEVRSRREEPIKRNSKVQAEVEATRKSQSSKPKSKPYKKKSKSKLEVEGPTKE